jgi:hypothetical protein
MKTIITLFAFSLGFSAMAQQEESKIATLDDGPEIGCIIPLKTIEPLLFVWDVDEYYRTQFEFPSWEVMIPFGYNEHGYFHLNEDLPFSQVLTTGAIYTFDYIRPMAR